MADPIRTQAHFNHTHAVVRGIPSSFLNALAINPPEPPVDLELAVQQHHQYVELIRMLVPHVVVVPADGQTPDCCFIEDTAIILGTAALNRPSAIAILTHPGAPSRRPEVLPVQGVLESLGFTLEQDHKAHRLLQLTAPATLDGGDVLFTGSSLWVGLSSRTNSEAVNQLKGMLNDICPVFGLELPPGDVQGPALHLKSLITALDGDLLLAAGTPQGHALVQLAQSIPGAVQGQSIVYVPDMLCSNVLRIGPNVVFQAGYPASEAIVMDVCKARGLTLHCLPLGELAKVDGALTCLSLLFSL